MPKDRNSMGAVTRRGPNAGGRSAAFSRWRRERPFWGSALAIIAGLEIYSAAAAPISVMAMQGLPGLLTICVALVAVIMGAVTLFQPVQRVITGWVVLVLGPISILATNLGGFVVGMIMLVVGGALILSWQPLGADEAAPAITSPLVADPYTPPEERDAYADDVADGAYAGTARSETAPVEPVGETATRNPWRNDPTSPLSGLGTTAASSEPVHAEPARIEPAPAEPSHAEPSHAEPVSAGPVRAEPGYGTAPEPDEPEPTRNPWRSRTPSAIHEETPEPAPAATERAGEPAPAPVPEPAPQPTSSSTPDDAPGGTTPNRAEPNAALSPVLGTDAGRSADTGTGTRSWFGNANGGAQLSPMEPPKSFVRTTLLIPLILVSIAASGLLAAPSAQAQAADLPCLISVLCPAPSPTPTAEPTAEPSAAPSATPSSGVALPTLPSLTDLLPGDTKDTGDAAKTPDLAGAADCPPAAKVPEGTTSGGQAAIDGAAAIQACQKAGETATITKAEATGTPPTISNVIAELKSPRLEMEGFSYDGIKTLNSAAGPVRVLAFSLSKLTVDGMDQTNGFGTAKNSVRIANTDGRVVISGNVKLYVTAMTGKILGLINLTFTPDFAPPLVLPSMFFTDTTSSVALVQADKITLPDLTLSAK